MKTQAEKARAFRALHEREGAFFIPNPFDVGSAVILEGMGFEALATTSAGHAFSLAKIDGQVTFEEAMEHARALTRATAVPVSADLGQGFGDAPEEVARTVRAAAQAGLVGCSIEDAPEVFGGETYPLPLAVERVTAAVEAARALPHDFILTARCENFSRGATELDDTLMRLQAYEKAGADVLFAPGLRDLGMIRTVCSTLMKPVNVLVGYRAIPHTLKDLEAAGVKRVSTGSKFAAIAYGAMIRAAEDLLATGRVPEPENAMRSNDIAKFFEGR